MEYRTQLRQDHSAWIEPILNGLKEGASFSDAMNVLFLPAIARSYLTVSESSGDLSQCLLQIADYMEQTVNLQTKLIRSLTYPVFLCFANLIIVVFLQYQVAPQLLNMYVGLNVPPSAFTLSILFELRTFVHGLPYAIGLLVLLAAILFYCFLYRPQLIERISGWMLSYPSALSRLYINWFWLSQLSVLLRGGIDVVSALTTISKTSARSPISAASHIVIERLISGSSFADSFKEVKWLDKRVGSFSRMGDKTGDYAAVITEAAQQIKLDLEDRLTRLPKQVEPVLIVLSAVFLGLVYLAMVLPVYDLMSQAS